MALKMRQKAIAKGGRNSSTLCSYQYGLKVII